MISKESFVQAARRKNKKNLFLNEANFVAHGNQALSETDELIVTFFIRELALSGKDVKWPQVQLMIKNAIKNQSLPLRGFSKIGMYLPFRQIKQELNTKKYAGAPLLGVQGNVMICHGGSDSESICYAILNTVDYLEYDLNTKLEEEIDRVYRKN